jgi:hypothetical protein
MHAPDKHVPPPQGVPHEPQFAVLEFRSASHPSLAMLLQLPNPAAQTLTWHVPLGQVDVALASEQGKHALPHVIGSASRAHVPPQRW